MINGRYGVTEQHITNTSNHHGIFRSDVSIYGNVFFFTSINKNTYITITTDKITQKKQNRNKTEKED